ncbi:mannose-6-phosphate isomerase type II [Burkholderia sp. H160]|nr:mannose-6-phosphate isomerase type II [Burkholderia sp. H160]
MTTTKSRAASKNCARTEVLFATERPGRENPDAIPALAQLCLVRPLVTNGDKEITLTENQSTYIRLGVTHRLLNPGKIPLELIEVESGAYLGEDDIVRFEDTYGRVAKV